METSGLKGTRAKAFLVLAKYHSSLFLPLSLNIVREICAYLSSIDVLAILRINSPILRLLDVQQNQVLEMDIGESVTACTPLCPISNSELVYVREDRTTLILDLKKQAKTVAAESMKEHRTWAGVVLYEDFVYVFGGNPNTSSLPSAERFHINLRSWMQCPDMHAPKCCFTPCVYQREIYLAVSDRLESQVEVFTPATGQYRLLPLRLSSQSFGSVSFIIEGELFHLNYDRQVYSWRLDSQESAPRSLRCDIMDSELMLCPGCVVRSGQFMHWITPKGIRVRFCWKDKILISGEKFD